MKIPFLTSKSGFDTLKEIIGALKDSNVPEWEKEFDKKFPDGVYGAEWHADGSFKCCWLETLEVKHLIRTLIASETAKERIKTITALKKELFVPGWTAGDDYHTDNVHIDLDKWLANRTNP